MADVHNTCVPDADMTLGNYDLIGKLLIALNFATGLWGTLTIYQLYIKHEWRAQIEAKARRGK